LEVETLRLIASTSTTPKGGRSPSSDLRAEQLVFDADTGDHRFQASMLLIVNIGFAAFQGAFAAVQDAVLSPTRL
jgi:hypothetical protein